MNDSVQSMGEMALKQGMAPPALAGKAVPSGNIDKAAQDFESMFMTQMLQPMFESVDVDSTFGGGHGEEIMRSFLVQEYGKIAAKSGHLGIAAMVKSEMIRAQASAGTSAANNGGLTNAVTQ